MCSSVGTRLWAEPWETPRQRDKEKPSLVLHGEGSGAWAGQPEGNELSGGAAAPNACLEERGRNAIDDRTQDEGEG